jgi:hypothetical protein
MSKCLALSVVALCAALVGCTHDEKTPDRKVLSAPVPQQEGKPMAPVAVTAELGPTRGRVTLTFEAPCEQSVTTVDGVDGLGVALVGAGLGERSFKAGQRASLEVELNGTGTLVVRVHGTFNGARKDRVVSFTVAGTPVAPDNGPAMKALPSGN